MHVASWGVDRFDASPSLFDTTSIHLKFPFASEALEVNFKLYKHILSIDTRQPGTAFKQRNKLLYDFHFQRYQAILSNVFVL